MRVSVATANGLAACVETLARRGKDAGLDLKWVAPVNYHLTLKFLGWTHDAVIGALVDALGEAVTGVAPIKFRTARLGAFPAIERASVVWAGVENAAPITELAARIEAASVGLGFAAETRPFHPHVTLARLRETRPVREVVLPMSEQMFSETRIDAITLFESETKTSGSVYRELRRIPFKPAENPEKRQTGALELGDETDDGWPRGHGQ